MKYLIAIILGWFSAQAFQNMLFLLAGTGAGEGGVLRTLNVIVLAAGTAASAWWIARRSRTVRRAIYHGCLLLIAEQLVQVPLYLLYRVRRMAAAEDAGPVLGVGGWVIMTLLSIGFWGIGVLLTMKSPREPVSGLAPSSANAALPVHPRTPRPTVTGAILLSEVLMLVVAVFLAAHLTDDWGVILAIPLLGIGVVYLIVSIFGLVSGIKLIKANAHRVIAWATTGFSTLPWIALCVGTVMLMRVAPGWVAAYQAGESQYLAMERVFDHPQALESAYVPADPDSDSVILLFAGCMQTRIITPDPAGLAAFCNEHMRGVEMRIELPPKDRFLQHEDARAFVGDRSLYDHWQELVRIDKQYGQSRMNAAAESLIRYYGRLDRVLQAETEGKARLASGFRRIADSDRSGFLSDEEGREFDRKFRFGMKVLEVSRYETHRDRIARHASTPLEDLETRADEYNALARDIMNAGIVEMPLVQLPPAD